MELIAAVAIAGPLGYVLGRRGLALYLVLWAIVFPIQTIVVHSENPDDIVVAYFVINGLILALGIGLNRLGAWLRSQRNRSASANSTP
jgi:peptidoglycan/LPS O-acetylase OafA/YrhL